MPKVAPNDCRTGVEFNNFYGKFSLAASSAEGSRSLTLEVDIATYRAPDRVRIVAITADGSERVIVDSCRLSTAKYTDPTGGTRRPPDDSLRYFHAPIPKGTKELSFDYGGTTSPTYIRVIGLCDFNVGAPKVVKGGTPPLRTVSD